MMNFLKKAANKAHGERLYPYVAYFLDHKVMRELPKTDPMVGPYRDLLSSTVPANIFEHIDDQNERRRSKDKYRMDRRLQAASLLLKNSCYIEMAAVDANTAELASKILLSVGENWWVREDHRVVLRGSPTRSLESFDIIFRFDEKFLKMPLGYIDMERGEYANEYI